MALPRTLARSGKALARRVVACEAQATTLLLLVRSLRLQWRYAVATTVTVAWLLRSRVDACNANDVVGVAGAKAFEVRQGEGRDAVAAVVGFDQAVQGQVRGDR